MKHWKRILSALLISAFALTLFAGCDKKVKVEDELLDQMADYCSTIGLKVEKEKDNSIAETAFHFLSSRCTGKLDKNFFGKTKNWKWTRPRTEKSFWPFFQIRRPLGIASVGRYFLLTPRASITKILKSLPLLSCRTLLLRAQTVTKPSTLRLPLKIRFMSA